MMSQATSQYILRPRARKPTPKTGLDEGEGEGDEGEPASILYPPHRSSLHSLNNIGAGGHGHSNDAVEIPSSELSSGRATPVPPDAPPSAHSISSARKQARAKAKAKQQRLFHSINYTPRVSHFDPASEYSDFRGFFVLFWIGLSIMVVTTALRNIKETGYPLRVEVYRLLSRNVVSLALSDIAMVASTAVTLPLQRLFRGGSQSSSILQWRRGGIWIQSLYQAVWLVLWVEWPFLLNWTWTAQVFFELHTLTFLMKMHSYAFYNGHLSETERRLSALDHPDAVAAVAAAAAAAAGVAGGDNPGAPLERAVKYPSSPTREHSPLRLDNVVGGGGATESSLSDHDRDTDLATLRQDLATELTSPLGAVTFPQNLTFYNYLDYILCPTLCYELEYPRTPDIRWSQVFYKTLAVFGCIFLMITVSSEFITPVLADSALRLKTTTTLSDQALILAETTSMLLFPFMITFLLVFLVIWEYVLGAFAELTCFADRHFYSDWWNSSDWLEFSREWNIPVYHFLRRHVYFSSLALFNGSTAQDTGKDRDRDRDRDKEKKKKKANRRNQTLAMAVTFLVSSLGHELIMGCITKKLRGYGFVAMMLQLPIVAIQRSNLIRGRWVFNNAAFWFSMILGLSMMCSLYVLV